MAIIDSVSIGNETRDIYDSGAVHGGDYLKITDATNYNKYFLIWEGEGQIGSYYCPTQIIGNIGYISGTVQFNITALVGRDTPRMYGFLEVPFDRTEFDIVVTLEGSGDNRHVRIYAYLSSAYQLIRATVITGNYGNITELSTGVDSVEGTVVCKMSDMMALEMSSYLSQSVTTSTSADVTVTFTDSKIKSNSKISPWISDASIGYSNITTQTGSCTITIPKQSSASTIAVGIYIS